MAFTALYEGDERGAWSVPKSERATCPECGDEMHVVSESTDGRARHFSHNPDRTGGGGGGGGCSGGESDDHKKWKNFAAERLHEIFGDRAAARASVEEPLAAPWSDKQDRAADACVFFENWDNQFGRGLAIEVQHKHKDKDKHAVEMDYNRQGVAVLWLSGEDFHENGLRMREVDIRHQTREQTSICEIEPPIDPGAGLMNCSPPVIHYEQIWQVANKQDRDLSVPAKIPGEVFDQAAHEMWRSQSWADLFPDHDGYGTDVVEMPPYPRATAEITIDIAPFFGSEFWERNWLAGKDKASTEPALPCGECGEIVDSTGHPESVAKLFKLHVKSNHKAELNRYDSYNDPYLRFLESKHRSRLDGSGSWIISDLKD